MDEVYTQIDELIMILAADLQIHPVRFPGYLQKWKKAKEKENSQSKDIRFLLCLIEIFSSST